MFKKIIISVFIGLLFLSSFGYSQEEKLQQYQTFSWVAIQNARKYEVSVEKLQDDETWKPETSQITTATRLEMLLYPGKYRVSIGAFNVLNKKASQSEWVSFIILDETEPFLFASTFDTGRNNTGSLFTKPTEVITQLEPVTIPPTVSTPEQTTIEQKQEQVEPTTTESELIEQEQTESETTESEPVEQEQVEPTTTEPETTKQEQVESTITKPEPVEQKQIEVYPQNTFRILGKNIYFSETEFFLVPINPDSSLKDAVTSYTVDRPQVKLQILSRDSTNNEVIVAYDETQLYTGLYQLLVKNPGNLTTSLNVNIYTSRLCEINKEQYEYNKRYQVPTLGLIRSKDTRFTIEGKNFSSDGKFSLIPAEGIPYPYSSIAKRVPVPLTLNDYSEVNKYNKLTSLSFSFNPSTIETGYYLFTADYGTRGKITELLLIDVLPSADVEPPKILTLKSKYNKKQNTIEFTVGGTQLDSDARGVLISPFSEENGKNERRTLTLTDFGNNKKKIIMNVETENLAAGTYAFLLETNGCQAITYVTIDAKYKAKLEEIPQEKVEELFLRPENMDVTEEMNVGAIEVTSAKIDFDSNNWKLQVYKKNHQTSDFSYEEPNTSTHSILSSNLRINASLNKGDQPVGNGAFDYNEYIYCKNVSESDIEKLQTGDSIRLKMKADKIKYWGIAFVCTDENGVETLYECPFSKFAELRKNEDDSYYCVEGKYDELWDTTWDFKTKKTFKAENVTKMYFYGNVTVSSSVLEVHDFEVFDSSTIPTKLVKKNPYFFTNGQVKFGGNESFTIADKIALNVGFNMTLLDFQYVALEGMYLYNFTDSLDLVETSLKISFAKDLVIPYVGGGIGTDLGKSNFMYIPLYAGIKLFRFFDLRYNCNINYVFQNNSIQSMYLKDSFSLGISLWFRTPQIKRVPKEIDK